MAHDTKKRQRTERSVAAWIAGWILTLLAVAHLFVNPVIYKPWHYLPNGSRIKVLKIVHGKPITYRYGTPIARLLQYLPGSFHKKFHAYLPTYCSIQANSGEGLQIFALHEGPSKTIQLGLQTETGWERSETGSSWLDIEPNYRILTYAPVVFPQSSQSLSLVVTNSHNGKLTTIPFDNPAYSPAPDPSHRPAVTSTTVVRGKRFDLIDLTSNSYKSPSDRNRKVVIVDETIKRPHQCSSASFGFPDDPSGWTVKPVSVTSPWNYTEPAKSLVGGPKRGLHLYPRLWAGDGPFRLKFEMEKRNEFDSTDLWTVTAEVPPVGGSPLFTTATLRHGVSVELVGVAGAGHRRLYYGASDLNPAVYVKTLGTNADKIPVNLVSAVDDAGRSVIDDVRDRSVYNPDKETAEAQFVYFELSRWQKGVTSGTQTTSGSVTLTFGICPVYSVEFIAEPRP